MVPCEVSAVKFGASSLIRNMFRLLVARPVIPSALTSIVRPTRGNSVPRIRPPSPHRPLVPVVPRGCAAKAITPHHWMRQMCEPQHSKFVIPNEVTDLLLGLKRRKNQCDPGRFR